MANGGMTNGVGGPGGNGNGEFFDEEDEDEYSDDDEYYDDDYDEYDEYGEEYGDEYDDNAEVVDVSGSRRGGPSRFRFDAKGRKIGLTRGGPPGGRGGRGGGNPKVAEMRERYRRKFCGHGGNPGSEETEQSRAKFGSRSR